jgi:hypothetical protein
VQPILAAAIMLLEPSNLVGQPRVTNIGYAGFGAVPVGLLKLDGFDYQYVGHKWVTALLKPATEADKMNVQLPIAQLEVFVCRPQDYHKLTARGPGLVGATAGALDVLNGAARPG